MPKHPVNDDIEFLQHTLAAVEDIMGNLERRQAQEDELVLAAKKRLAHAANARGDKASQPTPPGKAETFAERLGIKTKNQVERS